MTQTAAVQPGLELAGQGRRLAGFVLDLVILFVTLAIGWLIWLLVVGRRGQSPGKQLLNLRVVREDGSAVGLGWMLLREVVLKIILFSALSSLLTVAVPRLGGLITFALFAVAALWCVWDTYRQCLWDKVVGTWVVSPGGQGGTPAAASPSQQATDNLQTLSELHERGLLTDEEYEERRAREMDRL